jgi:hypothetical protein
MKPRLLSLVLGLILVSIAIRTTPTSVQGCAAAPPKDVKVEIASESAIIIWDATAKIQHFIRRATFNTSAQDFGFLVPTPSRPTLDSADDEAFNVLAKFTEPKTVHQARPKATGCGIGCNAAPKATNEAAGVEVLDEKRVGRYKAAVLKAKDAGSLTAWLEENKYDVRPALTRWAEPYIVKGWIITAFKIEKGDEKQPTVGTSAVRMSFAAEEPFFPYREPDDMHDAKGKRLLRVFFLGEKRYGGLAGASWWGAKTAWSNRLDAGQWAQMTPHLKIEKPPDHGWWLTEFEDSSSPRPGNVDVTFVAGKEQSPVERPAKIIYTSQDNSAGPTYLGLAALVLCLYFVRLFQTNHEPH